MNFSLFSSEYNSNFEMIADIISNYYYCSLNHYRNELKDIKSRLIASGVLDTLYELEVERSINPKDIVKIANEASQYAENQALVVFILKMEILIFKAEEPNMPLKDIEEAVYLNREIIETTVFKNSDKYTYDKQVISSLDNFIHAEKFKKYRKLIFNNFQKRRHPIYVVYIILLGIMNIISGFGFILSALYMPEAIPLQGITPAMLVLFGILNFLNVACFTLLYFWRKVGFYGYIIVKIVFLVNYIPIGGFLGSIINSLGILFLILILQLKKNDKSMWQLLY